MDQRVSNGIFTISLDFEAHWGVSEHRTLENYGENLKNVPRVVEQSLEIFKEFDLHVTWATVGMLFCKDQKQLSETVKNADWPNYENKKLSNYRLLNQIGHNYKEDPYHFALPLINAIAACEGQEIATHTFSHYYCLEKGQTISNFEKDLEAAIQVANDLKYSIKSIVFPRNQYNEQHLALLNKKGIKTFRGNESHWMYRPRSRAEETKLRKLARLIDAYFKISGDNTYRVSKGKTINIPSSRFLRPYDPKLLFLESFRLRRICREMTYAAKNNRLYHLWWHPHNFGKHIDENFAFLRKILVHFSYLNKKYQFQSLNMREIGASINE